MGGIKCYIYFWLFKSQLYMIFLVWLLLLSIVSEVTVCYNWEVAPARKLKILWVALLWQNLTSKPFPDFSKSSQDHGCSVFLQFTKFRFFENILSARHYFRCWALVETGQKGPHGIYIWEENLCFPILNSLLSLIPVEN